MHHRTVYIHLNWDNLLQMPLLSLQQLQTVGIHLGWPQWSWGFRVICCVSATSTLPVCFTTKHFESRDTAVKAKQSFTRINKTNTCLSKGSISSAALHFSFLGLGHLKKPTVWSWSIINCPSEGCGRLPSRQLGGCGAHSHALVVPFILKAAFVSVKENFWDWDCPCSSWCWCLALVLRPSTGPGWAKLFVCSVWVLDTLRTLLNRAPSEYSPHGLRNFCFKFSTSNSEWG